MTNCIHNPGALLPAQRCKPGVALAEERPASLPLLIHGEQLLSKDSAQLRTTWPKRHWVDTASMPQTTVPYSSSTPSPNCPPALPHPSPCPAHRNPALGGGGKQA